MLRDEVPAIRCALKNSGASRARLTLVMVTKQHNVRLMPTNVSYLHSSFPYLYSRFR